MERPQSTYCGRSKPRPRTAHIRRFAALPRQPSSELTASFKSSPGDQARELAHVPHASRMPDDRGRSWSDAEAALAEAAREFEGDLVRSASQGQRSKRSAGVFAEAQQ